MERLWVRLGGGRLFFREVFYIWKISEVRVLGPNCGFVLLSYGKNYAICHG